MKMVLICTIMLRYIMINDGKQLYKSNNTIQKKHSFKIMCPARTDKKKTKTVPLAEQSMAM